MYSTKKHFNTFKKEGRKWIDAFQLGDWRISIETIVANPKCQALADFGYDSQYGRLVLNENWEVKPTADKVRRMAFHEVMHLVLSDITEWVPKKFSKIILAMEHKVINRLEMVLFGRGE